MRVYINISQSAFTHFSNEAVEQGVSVRTLISREVERRRLRGGLQEREFTRW